SQPPVPQTSSQPPVPQTSSRHQAPVTNNGPPSPNCMIVPGAAMTFTEVCPNSNRSSRANTNLVPAQQPPSPPLSNPLPKAEVPSLVPNPTVRQPAPVAIAGPSQ